MKKPSKQAKQNENTTKPVRSRATKRLSNERKLHVPRRTDDSCRIPAKGKGKRAAAKRRKIVKTLNEQIRAINSLVSVRADSAKITARIGRAIDQRKSIPAYLRGTRPGDAL